MAKHGGKRDKTKPLRFGEQTTTWSVGSRVPKSRKQEMDKFGIEVLKPLILAKLKTWEVPKIKPE